MKSNKILFSLLFFALLVQGLAAQNKKTLPPYNPAWFLSLRGGYDLPFYDNQTPYIDYLSGLELGASLDYYFNWFGLGMDFDFIGNTPESIYPRTNLTLMGNPITNTILTEEGITRVFLGLGPSFRFEPSNRFTAEFKLRGGIGSIAGGSVELEGFQAPQAFPLNFHAGYDPVPVLSGKAQLQFNYFFNDFIGLHVGAYSLGHFYTIDLVDPFLGSTLYEPFNEQFGAYNLNSLQPISRPEPCNCHVLSVGAFAGITLRLSDYDRGEEPLPPPKPVSLKVTAKDKFTNEPLPNTDIALKTPDGKVIESGTTNSFGEVTFKNIPSGDYSIEGILFDTKLDGATANNDEFKPGKTLEKEIFYSDPNFIIKGRTILCNTNTPLAGIAVELSRIDGAEIKNTITNDKGEFIFHVKQGKFQLIGTKESYYSRPYTLTTTGYDRNNTLFVDLEICIDKIDCDPTVLNNILYEYDKHDLSDLAKKELDNVVNFMSKNPSIKLEIGSHTDSRGEDSYNKDLSQRRADGVVNYLVSRGVSSDRLKAQGYGESKLANRCGNGIDCPEDEHQVNRRTEMKVICPGNK